MVTVHSHVGSGDNLKASRLKAIYPFITPCSLLCALFISRYPNLISPPFLFQNFHVIMYVRKDYSRRSFSYVHEKIFRGDWIEDN